MPNGSADPAANYRDVPSTQKFWTAQLVLAYEHRDFSDNDPDLPFGQGLWVLGESRHNDGPSYVFTETIRDVAADASGLNNSTLVFTQNAIDVVADHELAHKLLGPHGRPLVDVNLMDNDAILDYTPLSFTPEQIMLIRSTIRPH